MILSLIVPTCNRSELLADCLNRLSPSFQYFDACEYEVIVTDDGNTGRTKHMLKTRYPWAKWVKGPQKGPASNRNNGVRYAKGDWLLFIDDDCLPDNNLLTVYYDALIKNKNILVFEGCIKADRKQQSLIEESPVNEQGGYLWSCNFMIQKKLFLEQLHGFDEQFPYASMEDVDLHYRLQKLHIDCLFISGAQVIHPWRLQKRLISITMKRFKSTLYFLKKHPERNNDLNSMYYIRAFYHSFFGQTLRNSFSYRFSGFIPKITNDLLHLYFAAYLLFYRKR